MNICKLFIISLILTLTFSCPLIANYSLEDVIQADETRGITNQVPSLLISEMTGKFLDIKGKHYQIRLFTFETKPIEDPEKKKLTFGEVIKKYNQLSVSPQQAPQVFYPVEFFMSNPQMEKDGVYYLLSLREMNN